MLIHINNYLNSKNALNMSKKSKDEDEDSQKFLKKIEFEKEQYCQKT